MNLRFPLLSGKAAVLAVSLFIASSLTASAALPQPTGAAFAKGAKLGGFALPARG